MNRRGGHVLATILFTDIVDASRSARELGDRRWRVLLARHHAIVRKAVKRHRGREIDNAGDGFFLAFDDQVDALRCACAISDGVRELGIEIRAGCHVGQAEILGRKLGGVTVHAAARVMSEAGPSEVLVSGVFKDLVPASGFTFTDRGVHTLKGIDGEWHLFAVTAVDGKDRPSRPDPEEAERRREAITPPPLVQRRWGRIAIAAVAVLLASGAVFTILQRPRPVQIVPSSVLRIDPSTEKVTADVAVAEPGAAQIAVVPPNEVWVLSQPEQVVTIVDADTNLATESVPIMGGQAFDPISGYGIVYGFEKVWVAPMDDSTTIEQFEPRLRQLDRTLTVPGNTGRLAQGFGMVWVPVAERGWHIAGLDPDTGEVKLLVKTALGGYGVAVGEEAVWVSNHDDSSVSKVDPVSGTAVKIDLGAVAAPSGIGFGSGSVWVSDALNGVVYRIDPDTNEFETIDVAEPSEGYQSDITELDGSMWVTSPGSQTIVRIDPATNAVVSRINVPYAPQDLIAAYGSLWVTLTTDPK